MHGWMRWGLRAAAVLLAGGLAAGCASSSTLATGARSSARPASTTVDLLTGRTNLHGTDAPNFTLLNQFNQPVSLAQFRGHVVLLAFIDSECTTVCPLTTVNMVDAVDALGAAGARVQLIAVDANPLAHSVQDVYTYSKEHGMLHRWQFLTGSPAQLQAVWAAYHIKVAIERGAIDHTPSLYLIDAQGRERYLYLTNGLYGAVGAESALLAHDLAMVLAIAHVPPLPASFMDAKNAAATIHLPALEPTHAGITLNAQTNRVVVFFGSWLPNYGPELQALNAYASWAKSHAAPGLVAIDEMPTETSRAFALTRTGALHLTFPVVEDPTGTVADAYGVHDLAWIALLKHGVVVNEHDGFVTAPALIHEVERTFATRP